MKKSEYRKGKSSFVLNSTNIPTHSGKFRFVTDAHRLFSFEKDVVQLPPGLETSEVESSDTYSKFFTKVFSRKRINVNSNYTPKRTVTVRQVKYHEDELLSTRNPNDLDSMYTLDIRVKYIEYPTTWRRIVVPGDINLYDLQDRILIPVLGYLRNHHAFFFDRKPFGPHQNEGFFYGWTQAECSDMIHIPLFKKILIDCFPFKVCDFWKCEGEEVNFTYDIGERWTHSIKCFKIDRNPRKKYIDIINGTGTGTVVDSFMGKNVDGLQWDEAMDILKDPNHKNYRNVMNALKNTANYGRVGRKFPSGENIDKFDIRYHRILLNEALKSKPSPLDFRCQSNQNYLKNVMGIDPRTPTDETRKKKHILPKKCVVCGKNNSKQCCGQCLVTRYCNTKCQRRDWKRHKLECRQLKIFPLPPPKLTEDDVDCEEMDKFHQREVNNMDIEKVMNNIFPWEKNKKKKKKKSKK